MKRHATVKIGDYVIPLIGIKKEETEETCDLCGETIPLRDAIVSKSGQVLCKKCHD